MGKSCNTFDLFMHQYIVKYKNSKVCYLCKNKITTNHIEKMEDVCPQMWRHFHGFTMQPQCPLQRCQKKEKRKRKKRERKENAQMDSDVKDMSHSLLCILSLCMRDNHVVQQSHASFGQVLRVKDLRFEELERYRDALQRK
ncbi:hypothetical protein PCYB_021330 [Plasmodium cynomolgi strain B]|uniref:Uncharacterized protein n=1 Tax=Plasmodium cynomolgi (strain B) TaxID=1120755 RepID=K6UPL7_PLACD|nr:hypothetical protein PCYB_021330 [Plasmodium cynomolgi strain B]GAB64564.1 hypothetical protein PCYB_021330 [Plasmodium cynomolgi strain B]